MVASICAADTVNFGTSTFSTDDEDECNETYTSTTMRVLNNDPGGDSCATRAPTPSPSASPSVSPSAAPTVLALGNCTAPYLLKVGDNSFSSSSNGLTYPATCSAAGGTMKDYSVFKFTPPFDGPFEFDTCKK